MATKKDILRILCTFLFSTYPFLCAAFTLNFVQSALGDSSKMVLEKTFLSMHVVLCTVIGIFLKLKCKVAYLSLTFALIVTFNAAVLFATCDGLDYSAWVKARLGIRSLGVVAGYVTLLAVNRRSPQFLNVAIGLLAAYSFLCGLLIVDDPGYRLLTDRIRSAYQLPFNLAPYFLTITSCLILSSNLTVIPTSSRQSGAIALAVSLTVLVLLPDCWTNIWIKKYRMNRWLVNRAALDGIVPILALVLIYCQTNKGHIKVS